MKLVRRSEKVATTQPIGPNDIDLYSLKKNRSNRGSFKTN